MLHFFLLTDGFGIKSFPTLNSGDDAAKNGAEIAKPPKREKGVGKMENRNQERKKERTSLLTLSPSKFAETAKTGSSSSR